MFKRLLQYIKRPLPAVLLVAMLVYSLVIVRYSRHFDRDYTGFACIGDWYSAPGIVTEDTHVIEDSPGYDGEFFFFIAHDPFIRTGVKSSLDLPAYRYQRIMYPLLAYILALSRPELIPYTMVLVNVLLVLFGTAFVIKLLEKNSINPWYALSYAFLSGLFLCTVRDLAGVAGATFMIGTMYFYINRKYVLSSCFMACAILSREFSVVLLACLALNSLILKKDWKAFLIMSCSFVPYVFWLLYMWVRLHDIPFRGGADAFGMPVQPLIGYVKWILEKDLHMIEKAYGLLFVLSTFFTVFVALKELASKRDEVSLPFALFSIIPLFMAPIIWLEPWGYGRVLLPMHVFLFLSFVKNPDCLHKAAVGMQVVLSVLIIAWLRVF